ncbi:MAG: sugar phosphate nucleotidyltransferase, partial [Actinomycetota bacterium]
DQVFASMGNYVFTRRALVEAMTLDAAEPTSRHDIGADILPRLTEAGECRVYDFATNQVPGATDRDRGYWRDVGTLDAYYEAQMDLISVHPIFNLYNKEWPIYSWHEPLPPAKFVFDDDGRRGHALDSMVSAGVIISGGIVRESVISPEVRVEAGAMVRRSVLMHGVTVGKGAMVRNAIIDKRVDIPAGARIGVNGASDRRRFTVSDKGIVVVGKNQKIYPE